MTLCISFDFACLYLGLCGFLFRVLITLCNIDIGVSLANISYSRLVPLSVHMCPLCSDVLARAASIIN